jgi:hypothetical protein
VITIGVRGDERGQTHEPVVPQIGRDHARAGVEAHRTAGAGVHDERPPIRQLHDEGVTLSHVEDADAQSTVRRSEDRPRLDSGRDAQRGHGTCQAPTGDGTTIGAQSPPRQAERERADIAGDGWPGRCGEVDGRSRHRGCVLDDQAQGDQHGPHRVERHRRGRLAHEREADAGDADHGGEPGQRNHDEVGHEPDRGHLIEMRQRDRQHRDLRGEADRHAAQNESAG